MRFYLSIVSILISCSVFGQQPKLTKGESATRDNFVALSRRSVAFSVARSGHRQANARAVEGFLYDDVSDRVFSITGSTVYSTSYSNREYLGSWSIALFTDPDLEAEIAQLYTLNNVTPEARLAENLSPILGCYFQHPLRYGDLNSDGSSELIIFAQDEFGALNFNVFSTVSNDVIFSARLATYDAKVNDRLALAEGEVESASDPLANAPTDGQYLSKIVEERTRMIRGVQLATINFSKLYFDDFDENGTEDILVWRKLYRSRENRDPLRGFQLLRESYFHYSFVSGKYVKQEASSNQVQAWLASNNLTWSQGYPSQSECAGHEGQLIPEMHDPLLNDPEVLPPVVLQ